MQKKAVSVLVSYILLVGITLVMSGLVYSWIKFRAEKPFAEESCPDGLSLILVSAECSGGKMTVIVQNKGLFDIDGYVIKSSDSAEGIPGKDSFNLCVQGSSPCDNMYRFSPAVLGSNEKSTVIFTYTNAVKQIEIEPYILKKGEKVYCEKAVVTSRKNCV